MVRFLGIMCVSSLIDWRSKTLPYFALFLISNTLQTLETLLELCKRILFVVHDLVVVFRALELFLRILRK